jgi:hypothetical protein
LRIGYCLECTPPHIFAAGSMVQALKSHALADGTVHTKTKTIDVEDEALRLGEKPQQFLDRLTEKYREILT